MDLNTELSKIDGITPKFVEKLAKFKIGTVKDLLWHFPFRYDDFSKVMPIADLVPNQPATIQGVIQKIGLRRTFKKHLVLVEAIIVDESGGVRAVWFNQAYLLKTLKPGTQANFAGKIIESKRDLYLSNPVYEITSSHGISSAISGPKHTAGLIPVYPETRGVTSKFLRFILKPILASIPPIEDFLPKEILLKNKLPDVNLAIKKIHFPLRAIDAETAKKRFAFENLFLLQLNNLKIKSQLAEQKSSPIEVNQEYLSKLITELPFVLTNSQKEVLHEVISDIQRNRPMNRLLQGDVGSGKTVIAAIAAILAAKDGLTGQGKQTAILAPTEVLAQQHFRTITKIFNGVGGEIEILTSSSKTKKLLAKIESGETKIVIGTHAIIQKSVKFNNLALVIVDEQHRFGVEQRAALLKTEKKSETLIPHLLSMSATPIPRTLALTIYGDLDLSIINELPAGRKPIITKIVDPTKRQNAYDFIKEQILKGRQAFVICPRIEASTKNEEDDKKVLTPAQQKMLDLKSVKEEFEKLSRKIFPDLKIAMLHGKMKNTEKETTMKDFLDKKFDVLVSTSVVELGVDIPNATIMMIEGADRFGLSQLYQFRGRVGRSEHQSFCLLFTDSESESTLYRLDSLLTAKNGFELAEKDLELRGPGQFLGTEQTGLPDIAMDALKNIELVKAAKGSAEEILSNDPDFSKYPLLGQRFKEFKTKIHLE